MFPKTLIPELKAQIEVVKKLHEKDLADGWGKVGLPEALGAKYPHHTGTPRSLRRKHHHDLHPRSEQRRRRRNKPLGQALSLRISV